MNHSRCLQKREKLQVLSANRLLPRRHHLLICPNRHFSQILDSHPLAHLRHKNAELRKFHSTQFHSSSTRYKEQVRHVRFKLNSSDNNKVSYSYYRIPNTNNLEIQRETNLQNTFRKDSSQILQASSGWYRGSKLL